MRDSQDGWRHPWRAATVAAILDLVTSRSANHAPVQPLATDGRARVRVIVVDDHAAVREGIRAMLGSDPDIDPIAAVATAREAVALADRHRPDVMVLDYHLPDLDGLSLCLRLKGTVTPPAVLIYSAFADERLVALAIVAGADALLSKAADPEALCDIVRALADGGERLPAVAPATMQAVASQLDTTDLPIFGMLAHGTPPVEIATTLRIDRECLDMRRRGMLSRLAGRSQDRPPPGRQPRVS